MTAIPLLGVGAETPVEGQPLLTIDVVTDEMGRSALHRNLDSLRRDFYCRCICDPLGKLKNKLPMSTIKAVLLCTTGIAILVCLTILEVVGAHRQGELQHALKERLRFRNLTDETLHFVKEHRASATVVGQYGQRLLAPFIQGGGRTDNSSTVATAGNGQENSTGVPDSSPGFQVMRHMGMPHLHNAVMKHMEKVSNYSRTLSKSLMDALTPQN